MGPTDKSEHYFTTHHKSELDLRKHIEFIRGQTITFYTSSSVFSAEGLDEGTRVLIENMILPTKGPILDLGAGYGPVSLWLTKEFQEQHSIKPDEIELPQIYASEINDRAIWVLNKNLTENKCKEVIVLKGDFLEQAELLKNTQITFTAIYTNPPLKRGHEFMLEFFEKAFQLLHPSGFIQYVHKKNLGAEAFIQKLIPLRPDWNFEIVAKKAGYFIYLISPQEIEYE